MDNGCFKDFVMSTESKSKVFDPKIQRFGLWLTKKITVFLVFKSLKTLFKIFTYGIIKKEILTTKSNLGVDIKIKIK